MTGIRRTQVTLPTHRFMMSMTETIRRIAGGMSSGVCPGPVDLLSAMSSSVISGAAGTVEPVISNISN